MRCPDPRYWAAHKLWLSTKSHRDPQKKIRDRQQADVMLRLIREMLPQFPFDVDFRRMLLKELAGMLELGASPGATGPSW